MNFDKINNWLQLLGTFGVVGSLVFVGLEMQQAREIAVSEAYQTRTQFSLEATFGMASNPEFTSAYAKLSAGDVQNLSPGERVALEYYMGGLMMLFENAHFQWQQGFLSDEHWQRQVEDIRCNFTHPYFRGFLDQGWNFRESFASLVREIIEEVDRNPSDCWPEQSF